MRGRGRSAADQKRSRAIEACEDLVRFGVNLRAIRRHRGLTIRDVHERSGLSEAYLSEVERALANISLQNMALLATAVGSSVSELLLKPE